MLPAKRTCFLVLLGYLVRVGPPFGVSRQSAVDLERSPGEGVGDSAWGIKKKRLRLVEVAFCVEPLPGIGPGTSSLPWMRSAD